MIDDFPLTFFLPLVVHALAGLMTGVAGIMAFRASICPGYADGTAWAALADLFLRPSELGTQPARGRRGHPPEGTPDGAYLRGRAECSGGSPLPGPDFLSQV